MNKTIKYLLLVLMAIIGLALVALIAYEILIDVRGIEVNDPPTYSLASVAVSRQDRQGRLYRVNTDDTIVCGNGNTPTVTAAEVNGRPALVINCDGDSTPTPSATASATAPPTPTSTTAATPTLAPTPTTEPSSLPLCDIHNPNQHHGLATADCHYDHTHFGDPAQLDWLAELTDSPWPFDQSISYPHQTPNENALKHTGYIYTVNSTAPTLGSDEFTCVRRDGGSDCVYAWRIQTHSVGGPRAMTTRVHSIYGQIWVGNPNGSIGSISAGGWVDWGHLTVPYKQEIVPTDQDGPFTLAGIPYDAVLTNVLANPYRANSPQFADGPARGIKAQWNQCSNQIDDNHSICIDFVNFRDWGGVDTNEPANIWLVCPEMNCDNNHSNIRPYNITVSTPNELGSGYINFEGWTDLKGNIVDESECGVNAHGIFTCAPLVIKNVYAGSYQFEVEVGTNAGDDGPQDKWQEEYDTSPVGEWWIKYPYR